MTKLWCCIPCGPDSSAGSPSPPGTPAHSPALPAAEQRPDSETPLAYAMGRRPSDPLLRHFQNRQAEASGQANSRKANKGLLDLPAELFLHILSFVPESCEADMSGIHEMNRWTYELKELQEKRAFAWANQREWLHGDDRWHCRLSRTLAPLQPVFEARRIDGPLLEAAALCDAELAAGRAIPADKDGLVQEFIVQQGPGTNPVRYFRPLLGDTLRRAPAPDDPEHGLLLEDIINKMRESHFERMWTIRVAEDSRWQTLLDGWNAALPPGTDYFYSGGDAFEQLSYLCDQQFATTPGKEIGTLTSGTKVLEFELVPDGGAAPLKLLREMTNSNSVRLAPSSGNEEEYAAVLQLMDREDAQLPALPEVRDAGINQAPAGRIPYLLDRALGPFRPQPEQATGSAVFPP